MEDLAQNIEENSFLLTLRLNLRFDEEAYADLIILLKAAIKEYSGKDEIPRRLAQSLYIIPQMVRNTFLMLKDEENQELRDKRNELRDKLEDTWIDLDALVLECLA